MQHFDIEVFEGRGENVTYMNTLLVDFEGRLVCH